MRSFVVILVATLVMVTVITGLLAFVLPFDLLITRIHAATAPVFAFFVIWHVIHNRKAFGRVMKVLDETDLTKNTIVIFTSDNGSYADNLTKKFDHLPNAPWRGLKADIWEGGHRVPQIVRWPGVVESGSTSEQVVCLVDWYATFAELHGIKLSNDQAEDSCSMLGLLKGNEKPIRQSLIHHAWDGTFAIRKGDWKLIEGNLGSGGFSRPGSLRPKADGPQGQLYNLTDDPKETTNLWLDQPAKASELLAELNAIRDAGRSR